MADPKSPSVVWPHGPVDEPKSELELREEAWRHEDAIVGDAHKELDDITRAAGVVPQEPPVDVATSAPMDPATAELLTPAGTPASPDEVFQKALTDGTIPSFSDLPADTAVDPNAPPLDPTAEREAWQSLIAFINAHKDPGTVVTIVDPDTFITGL